MKLYFNGFIWITTLLSSTSYGTTLYQCKNSDGSKSYQDRPCEAETLKVEELKKETKAFEATSSETDGNVTAAKLIGTWTDVEDPKLSAYRSTFSFNGYSLTVNKPTGFSFTRRYQLKGNILHVFHPRDDKLNQDAFTEELEIEEITHKVIKWGESGPIGVSQYYKLY